MEIVIVILALVYSVWSEIQKKKQEEDINIDFPEVTSLDDFFKSNPGTSTSGNAAYRPGKKKRKNVAASHDKKTRFASDAAGIQPQGRADGLSLSESRRPFDESTSVNYDNMPGLTGRGNRNDTPKSEVNYDELPSLSGLTNYEDSVADVGVSLTETNAGHHGYGSAHDRPAAGRFTLSREDLLKTIVMTEVLQRYNINRIYDRIPGPRPEN